MVKPLLWLGALMMILSPALAQPGAAALYNPKPDITPATRFIQNLAITEPEAGAEPLSHEGVARIGVYGDSTAAALNVGLQFWLDRRGNGRARMGLAELGCGLLRKGVYRFRGSDHARPEHCRERTSAWRASITRDQPDIALVLYGTWEVCDRKLPGENVWRHPGDPILDEELRKEMLDAVDMLSAKGALVVWLTHPVNEVRDLGSGDAPATSYPESDPLRMARLNDLIRELPESRPEKVQILDLAAYMRTLPGGELDKDYRPDGIHYSPEGTLRLAHDWLEAETVRLYREARSARSSATGNGRESAQLPKPSHP
ncbi:MAG: SGNH hydrolase domain-containing protein [bacterium]